MAAIEEALYDRATTFAGLTALISTRFFPLKLPQNVVYPACSYHRVSSQHVMAMGADPGLARVRIQVDSFDKQYSGVKAVQRQVRLAFERWSGTHAGVTVADSLIETSVDFYDEDVNVFQVSMDFDVIFYET